MMETEMDCYTPSACSHSHAFMMNCVSAFAHLSSSFFQTDADKHCSWSLLPSLHQFLNVATPLCLCTKNQCGVLEFIDIIQQHHHYFINTFWSLLCETIKLYKLIFTVCSRHSLPYYSLLVLHRDCFVTVNLLN